MIKTKIIAICDRCDNPTGSIITYVNVCNRTDDGVEIEIMEDQGEYHLCERCLRDFWNYLSND